jgi:hypothetical protein
MAHVSCDEDAGPACHFRCVLGTLRLDQGTNAARKEKARAFVDKDAGQHVFVDKDAGQQAFVDKDAGQQAFVDKDAGKQAFALKMEVQSMRFDWGEVVLTWLLAHPRALDMAFYWAKIRSRQHEHPHFSSGRAI